MAEDHTTWPMWAVTLPLQDTSKRQFRFTGALAVWAKDYLRYRIASTAYLGNHIASQGVPIVQPPGGHAIYLDARAFLPHVPPDQFPGVALAAELYLEGGIRSVEIGTLMFAGAAKMDLVRLAIPRRVYTQSHIDYVVEVILEVWKNRERIPGMKLTYEAPFLRHFTAHLEPVNLKIEEEPFRDSRPRLSSPRSGVVVRS